MYVYIMENINQIIYINLDKREDRKNELLDQLKNIDFPENKITRLSAVNMEDTPGIGCCYSHLNAMLLAKENNYKNVLILEDDFDFLVTKEELETNLQAFFDLNIEWDVLFLSRRIMNSEEVNDIIVKGLEVQTASGYLVNGTYYDKLITNYTEGINLYMQTKEHWNYQNDQYWKKLQLTDNWYCFKIIMGKQRNSYSDLGKKDCCPEF